MSRLVKAKSRGLHAKAAGTGADQAREYLERVSKYVPAEIIAAYTAINGGVITLPESFKYWFLLGNLIICKIFTPIYFALLAKPEEPKRTQQVVSLIAFFIWAYSISNDDTIFGKGYWNVYYAGIATAIIIIFSLISGAIVPKTSTPPNS